MRTERESPNDAQARPKGVCGEDAPQLQRLHTTEPERLSEWSEQKQIVRGRWHCEKGGARTDAQSKKSQRLDISKY